jgi:hypothetical protein
MTTDSADASLPPSTRPTRFISPIRRRRRRPICPRK